jgi:hypothetical protein
MVAFGGIP